MSITLNKIEKMIDAEADGMKSSFGADVLKRLAKKLYRTIASDSSTDVVAQTKSEIKYSADDK
jgi:hypothetical protein